MERKGSSSGSEQVGIDFYGRSLIDEIQAQQHGRHAISFFHPSFKPLQCSAFDANAHALTDRGREPDLEVAVQCQENVRKLLLKFFLVENLK